MLKPCYVKEEAISDGEEASFFVVDTNQPNLTKPVFNIALRVV
jgi:hypothetical protein